MSKKIFNVSNIEDSGGTLEKQYNKGSANGYAGLDAGATVPLAQIPGTLTGKNADQLDGQDGSFYQNADNINAGTLADARLPSTQAGKTFASRLQINNAGAHSDFTGGAQIAEATGTGATFDVGIQYGLWFAVVDGGAVGNPDHILAYVYEDNGAAQATKLAGSANITVSINGGNIRFSSGAGSGNWRARMVVTFQPETSGSG